MINSEMFPNKLSICTVRYLFILLLLCILSPVLTAQTGARYALVIGNTEYQRIEKLKNTVNDANDVANALKTLGYQVDLKLNITRHQMIDAIDAYAGKLSANTNNEGFFWFAGHGFQIHGENYLLPVDVTVENERRVEADSYSLNALLNLLKNARNKVNVVIIDACRNNPFPSSFRGATPRGLTVVNDIPKDLFVMFSTAPDDVAIDGSVGKRNSPFAEAFLKNMNSAEALPLMAVDIIKDTASFTDGRQQPYYRGSILIDKYYSLKKNNPSNSAPVVTVPQIIDQPITLDSAAMREQFNGDWIGDDIRIQIIGGDKIIQYFRNEDDTWYPVVPEKEYYLYDRNNLVYIWLNKGGVWSETQVFSLSAIKEDALSLVWQRHVNNISSNEDNDVWNVRDRQTLFLSKNSDMSGITKRVSSSNNQIIDTQFKGIWIGEITIRDENGGSRMISVKIDIANNKITQYFKEDDNNWYIVTPDKDNYDYERNNIVYSWVNKGGIWSETQVYSLSVLNNKTLNIVWLRHVNNHRDNSINNTWDLTGEGKLIKQ
ncbi:MAG: caspase family protein [Treponema sp.]|jgi:hypothetical protein|nr:caspase family protein [Treponema sp.]